MTNAAEPHTDRELLLNINSHVEQLTKDVTDIKEKLEATIDTDFCDRQHVVITKSLSDDRKDIDSLINFRWYIMGAFAIAIVIVTALIQILR
jgi:hypothetical protein